VGKLINSRKVKVNGRVVWLSSWKVKNGDRLEILETPPGKRPAPDTLAEEWIISHESDLVVLYKPAGLLSHAVRSEGKGDLLNLATERFGPLDLFHRLDRDTSGLVLLTRGGSINRYLDDAFKAGTVEKEYIAAVPAGGHLPVTGVIRTRIGAHPVRRDMMAVVERGGRHATTRYEIIGEAATVRLLRLWPQTGRTHQLRVHLLSMGVPILGDKLYSPKAPSAQRLMLHAHRLVLPEMASYPRRVFKAPLPEDFLVELPRTLQEMA
jgi:23S rRNA pseudouridine1911/1915/1917 synthase